MTDQPDRIEISESTLTKLASMLATIAPIGLGVLQYVNDPNNIVGILVCLLLLVVLVLWNQTQKTVRELKADIQILRGLLEAERNNHAQYKEISNNTIVNMFAWINRLAGERDAGSITLDKDTGASVYVAPVVLPVPPQLRRASDLANAPTGQ